MVSVTVAAWYTDVSLAVHVSFSSTTPSEGKLDRSTRSVVPTAWDLSASTGAPAATGTPSAYVRADGVLAIVFRSSADRHVRELTLGGSGWQDWDLTVSSE
ncbi:hypothetical protein [Sorangium sp. So ce1099]|uniref:hypothetical protein n=1 Tax=Sorangium sp. So ce1099 TaxID=3133331 RepID=UPI003F6477F4